MQRRSHRAHSRVAGLLAALVALTAAIAACRGCACAARPGLGASRSAASACRFAHPRPAPTAAQAHAEAARVARYWTPARMRGARPLDLVVGAGGRRRLRIGASVATAAAAQPLASASFLAVPTPDVPPYSFNGRIFIRRGDLMGYCSGTAIDSPTRQLVLTAGHCVNSGHEGGKASVWSRYLEFVPAYDGGAAPFGAFVARRGRSGRRGSGPSTATPTSTSAPSSPCPTPKASNVADAVGGGATIVTDLSRHQNFQTFGYPGETKYMQRCVSPYIGDDPLSNPFPGPPTMGIRCHWAARRQRRRLADRRRHRDQRRQHLPPPQQQVAAPSAPTSRAETVGKLVSGL